jgi:periplasmic protein TonB
VVEEPRRSILPYFALAVMAAVGFWTIQQSLQDSTPADRKPTSKAQQPKELSAEPASGDLRTIFNAGDYPVDAQRNGQGGTVQAELSIDTQGRVSGCTIVHSSGHSSLDDATCDILRRRARFTPARDVNGATISSTMTTPPVVWRLEG